MALLRAERSNGFVTGNPSACPLLSQAVEPDEFCEPLERVNIGGETLDLNPCGLIANSMFNGERMGRGGAARACVGGWLSVLNRVGTRGTSCVTTNMAGQPSMTWGQRCG